jgi:hypothetical protein
MNPHTRSSPRYEKRGAVPAELPPEIAVDPDPLAHRYPPCNLHVPAAQFWLRGKSCLCLGKEHRYTLAGDLFGLRGAGTLFHRQYLIFAFAYVSAFHVKNAEAEI